MEHSTTALFFKEHNRHRVGERGEVIQSGGYPGTHRFGRDFPVSMSERHSEHGDVAQSLGQGDGKKVSISEDGEDVTGVIGRGQSPAGDEMIGQIRRKNDQSSECIFDRLWDLSLPRSITLGSGNRFQTMNIASKFLYADLENVTFGDHKSASL